MYILHKFEAGDFWVDVFVTDYNVNWEKTTVFEMDSKGF